MKRQKSLMQELSETSPLAATEIILNRYLLPHWSNWLSKEPKEQQIDFAARVINLMCTMRIKLSPTLIRKLLEQVDQVCEELKQNRNINQPPLKQYTLAFKVLKSSILVKRAQRKAKGKTKKR